MDEKAKRSELLITLDDINALISKLEGEIQHLKATDKINQLLYAYDIKIKIIHEMH